MSSKTKLEIIVSLLLAALPALGLAAGDRPVVSGARLYVYGGNIVSDLRCGGLFPEEIAGTVQSGLPAVVELFYSVNNSDSKTVKRGVHSFELRYDVWEDVYSVSRSDSAAFYSSFENMSAAIEALTRVSVIPLRNVDAGADYSISFSIAVHPLRGTEKEKLEGWVGETVGGRESGAWHEQVLNLNELIKRFFSRGKETSRHSDWFHTESFTPRELPGAPRETGRRDGERPLLTSRSPASSLTALPQPPRGSCRRLPPPCSQSCARRGAPIGATRAGKKMDPLGRTLAWCGDAVSGAEVCYVD